MKTTITFSIAIALVAFAAACNTTPMATNGNMSSGMDHNTMPMNHDGMNNGNMNSGMMQDSANAPYDLQFLDTMSAHHQGAITMSGGCAAKAQHAEIKTLCANVIDSQQKEIADMKSWRDNWYAGLAPAMNMNMPGMGDSMKGMDMQNLNSLTGNAYDLAYIKQMIPHHEGAVIMAKEALRKSTKPEIKTLAEAIIKAQEEEIKKMKDWQYAWSK